MQHVAPDVVGVPNGHSPNVKRLDVGVTLEDMRVAPSDDGQCLLVYCRDRVVALLSAMGCDVEVFEFANAERILATDLIDRVMNLREAGSGSN